MDQEEIQSDSNKNKRFHQKVEKVSDVSRFKLDGVVAEMEIEIEEYSDAFSSSEKALKLNEFKSMKDDEIPSRNELDSNSLLQKVEETNLTSKSDSDERCVTSHDIIEDSIDKQFITTDLSHRNSKKVTANENLQTVDKVKKSILRPRKGIKRTTEVENLVEKKLRKDETPERQTRQNSVSFQSGISEVVKSRRSTSLKNIQSYKPTSTKSQQHKKQTYDLIALMNSKPKPYNLSPNSSKRLHDLSDVCDRLKKAELKYARALYRILYDKLPPKDNAALQKEILDFKGFSCKKSINLGKHQIALKKLPELTIAELSKILDTGISTKDNMISEIMKFLIKPVKCIMSPINPFIPSMQPVVKLVKISLDKKYVKKAIKSTFGVPEKLAIGKRKRFPSTKLNIYNVDLDVKPSDKISIRTEKENNTKKMENLKEKRNTLDPVKNVMKPSMKSDYKGKKNVIKAQNIERKKRLSGILFGKRRKKKKLHSKPAFKKNKDVEEEEMNVEEEKMDIEEEKMDVENKKIEPTIEDTASVNSGDVENEEDNSQPNDDLSAMIQPYEEYHSDVTLSADESREEAKKTNPTKKKKITGQRCGKPLGSFPNIKEKIMSSNTTSLQRLHIFLFGTPFEKVENLKGHILAFGGFPFLEGSDDWKQKEFVFSLAAQADVKDYMDLLCIDYEETEDQNTLINKLMKFLAAPNDKTVDMETEIVSSEPVNMAPTTSAIPAPKKVSRKKKPVKEKKDRRRKVLMDEAEVRRLEADFAREQRILARERKLQLEARARQTTLNTASKMKSNLGNQSDTQLLNALLQTVYKRRALKQAGAKVSVPNKGVHTRLGELDNVKFLIVTANHNDLDILHHLIYMTEASKARVRKNILDFAGFNFAEDSSPYIERIAFLRSLGYQISKRIAFLLGLCPFKMQIPEQDLNELIMYFLMSPCKSKQIPIRHLPANFFRNEMPQEISQLLQKHSSPAVSSPITNQILLSSVKNKIAVSTPKSKEIGSLEANLDKYFGRKAKKSFSKTSDLSPSMQLTSTQLKPKLVFPLHQKNLISGLKYQQNLKTQHAPNLVIQQTPSTTTAKQQIIQLPPELLQGKNIAAIPGASPHEFLIQQKTPDGQQKTYKLVKLPVNHPLNAALKKQTPESKILLPSSQPMAPLAGPPLPPGIVLFKNDAQTLPYFAEALSQGSIADSSSEVTVPDSTVSQDVSNVTAESLQTFASDKVDSPKVNQEVGEGKDVHLPEPLEVSVECNYSDDEFEELDTSGEPILQPPTKDELLKKIQEIICSSNYEDITLRNVFDRVSAQYSSFDLKPQYPFMKECVKKIIIASGK